MFYFIDPLTVLTLPPDLVCVLQDPRTAGILTAGMERRVRFLDLRMPDPAARAVLLGAIDRVFQHGQIVLGPEVAEFERQLAESCGRRHAVGIGSGTDALLLAIKALGIGPGDEVIVPALSWIATANAVALSGATPVFADVGDDLNIDPASVEMLVGSRTRAILCVHYTGKICNMEALTEIASNGGLHLLEDAAQSFGARRYGRPAGSFGVLGCFSMNPMKVLAACGEAGAIVTDRDDLDERLRALRYNGTVNRETCTEPSLNGRLDTIQAAILLERLPKVAAIIQKRREIASWYREALADVVGTPCEKDGEFDAYYTYQVRATRRDELKAHLEACGIETKIQHPSLMPDQPAYQKNRRGRFDKASRIVKEILCLPANERLSREAISYVCDHVRDFYRRAGEVQSAGAEASRS